MNRKLYLLGLSVELILLLAMLSGCMKEPDYKQDFGSETTAKDVLDSIFSSDMPVPDTTIPHEFAYTETLQKVEDLAPQVVGQKSYELLTVDDHPQYIVWNILRQVGELKDGQMVVSQWNDAEPLCKPEFPKCTSEETQSIAASSVPSPAPKFLISPEMIRASALGAKAASGSVTFHNLKKSRGYVSVPPLVQARANCGGLRPEQCHRPLPVTKVSFDQVVWDGEYGEKIAFYLTLSSDIPYLATASDYRDGIFGFIPGLLSLCLETNVSVQNQRVHLIQCDDIKDFSFGHQ